ncbi:ANK2 [Symbiodinium sp. CCMP2592]|nr:ANK2 [Symbiodinium sp. CCMP2592]
MVFRCCRAKTLPFLWKIGPRSFRNRCSVDALPDVHRLSRNGASDDTGNAARASQSQRHGGRISPGHWQCCVHLSPVGEQSTPRSRLHAVPGVARRFTPNVVSITPLAYGRDDRGVSSEKEGLRHSAVPTGPSSPLSKAIDSQFTVAEDRVKLGPVLQGPEDHDNHLELGGSSARSVQRFLHQNGFRSIHEVDGSGWAPVHYAAMPGDSDVIHGLLEMRADIDRWTKKDQPQSGMLLGMTPLQICGFFRHYSVMRLLISAKARVDSGLHPDISVQCLSDDPVGVRILCNAGCALYRRNFLGMDAFDTASSVGALAALEELVTQAGPDLAHADLSKALCMAAAFQGARAELIQRLLDLRAPVDAVAERVAMTIPARVLLRAKALQHRYGKDTPLSRFCYHTDGQTPLMAAIMSGQYEGAATLIASGARVDLRNSRGWTAADFAAGHLLPDFLREALQCKDPRTPVTGLRMRPLKMQVLPCRAVYSRPVETKITWSYRALRS